MQDLPFEAGTHLPGNGYVSQPEQVVHRMPEVLLASEIALGGLHGCMAQQELNLLDFAAAGVCPVAKTIDIKLCNRQLDGRGKDAALGKHKALSTFPPSRRRAFNLIPTVC